MKELLGALETATTAEQRRHYRDWIQRLQVTCTVQQLASAETRLDHSLIHSSTQPRLQVQLTGYRGSPALDAQTQSQDDGLLVATSISSSMYDQPHLAMTYAALMCLLVLGGDSDGKGSGLEDVDSAMIVRSLRMLQQENGRYDVLRAIACFVHAATYCTC